VPLERTPCPPPSSRKVLINDVIVGEHSDADVINILSRWPRIDMVVGGCTFISGTELQTHESSPYHAGLAGQAPYMSSSASRFTDMLLSPLAFAAR
jgi:hypothetical protein